MSFFRDWFIYDEICDYENLLSAWNIVKRKNGASGIDGVDVKKFSKETRDNLESIRNQLVKQEYSFLPVREYSFEKKSGKKRYITIYTVKDRIVQRAMLNILDPIVDPMLSENCLAYRKGKGIKNAIKLIRRFWKMGFHFFLKADIENYFDSIPRRQLILRLIERYLQYGIKREHRVLKPVKGLSQGGILSPLLANVYLKDFDFLFESVNNQYIRYSDDLLLASKNSNQLKKTILKVRGSLKLLGLKIKDSSVTIYQPGETLSYLGCNFISGKCIKSCLVGRGVK